MWMEVLVPIGIGLAIFLFGMKIMELAMQYWAGPYLESVLNRFTATPWRGMAVGTGLTALLQSSSAITVITIGLVNAGLMTFPRTLGIILGTNIGSCLTTELIGLNFAKWSVPLLFGCASIWMLSWLAPNREMRYRPAMRRSLLAVRYVSLAVCGFACVLIGMEVMQSIVPVLQSRGMLELFLSYARRSLLWGVLAGAVMTAIIQSSAATIAMAMSLASMHVIGIDLGIAVVIGANIGTCGTALIASIGANRAGRFVAYSHLVLNVCGAALFFPFIHSLASVSAWLTAQPASQLAHAQTIFNIACSLIALPICYLPVFRRPVARQ